jgi:hypothetical protein
MAKAMESLEWASFIPTTASLCTNRQPRLLPELPRRLKQKTMLSKMRTFPADGFGDEDAWTSRFILCKSPVTMTEQTTGCQFGEHSAVGPPLSLLLDSL